MNGIVCSNWKTSCFAVFLYILFDYVTVLFGDCQIAEKILKTKDPRKIKSLGRKVKGFTDEVWDDNCLHIVRLGNVCKVRYLGLNVRKPVWGVSVKASFKPVSSAAETS